MRRRRGRRAHSHGKSALALAIAQRFNGEIVACDSTAVYRGIDIGTDKVPLAEQGGVPHHLVDVVEPTETYSAARYARDAADAIRAIIGARAAADPRRRHGVLLSRARARACFRARRATTRCARGSSAWRSAAAWSAASLAGAGRPGVGARASSRAIASASCARSRCIC